jgi:hypothetical protein
VTSTTEATTEREPDGAPGAGTVALALGAMALLSAWTGWGGIVLGLAALVAVLVALGRARAGRVGGPHPRRRPLIGLALGVAALAIGFVVEWPTITASVTYLHSSQVRTLDECMRQAVNEKEQHVCKSQHLDEYRARYPGRIDL